MVEKFRQILKGPAGWVLAGLLVIGGLAYMFRGARDLFGESATARDSRDRVFVCAETGKPFRYTITESTRFPVPSPHSNKDTGYPAQFCFWTKDGKTKAEPTPVLLKAMKGESGPTFCPDCGRLVVNFNPPPGPGVPVPPTEAEWKTRRTAPTLAESETNTGE